MPAGSSWIILLSLLLLLFFGCISSVQAPEKINMQNKNAPTPNLPAPANITNNTENGKEQVWNNATGTIKNNPAVPDANTPKKAANKQVNACSKPADIRHMDIFDSHAHIISSISASQIISEMDKAGVSMLNLYPIDGDNDSSSLEAIYQNSGRFITFVDTPDSPQPAMWFIEGQSFVAYVDKELSTGKFYGIGETNLRYYSGSGYTPPPDIYVPPDNQLWLQLVNLSVKYHVPVSFHFVPDDPNANAALERMLGSNRDAVFIWAHLGFNNMPLNSATLNGFLLRYPNLYFDTAGIQNMQKPPPQPNSNWGVLVDESDNGRLNKDWKQFFERWNSRILFGSDAGGGPNGLQRWLNYADNAAEGATPDAIGHWRSLLSYTDPNTAHNILSANARKLFLKESPAPYSYQIQSDGGCYPVFVSSNSSVSAFKFDPDTKTITFTTADSVGTTDYATIIIPAAMLNGTFIAQVDGQIAQIKEASDSANIAISLEYQGGIRTVTLSLSGSAQ